MQNGTGKNNRRTTEASALPRAVNSSRSIPGTAVLTAVISEDYLQATWCNSAIVTKRHASNWKPTTGQLTLSTGKDA